MSCKFCRKQFNRGYNLRRHEKEYCPLRAQERNMSQTDSDSPERDFQDDVSRTSTDVSETSMRTDMSGPLDTVDRRSKTEKKYSFGGNERKPYKHWSR